MKFPWSAVILTAVAASPLNAQRTCVVPADSNEAKLLAFYAAPMNFAPVTAPVELGEGAIRIIGEAAYIPDVDPSINRTTTCFHPPKTENTNLSKVFPRPRIAIGLPSGFALEVSYLPPLTVAGATPNLFGAAVSYTRRVASGWLLAVRGTVTAGQVTAAITCPQSLLQETDPAGACYGGDNPSDDAFHPTSVGGDATVGWTSGDGTLSVFAGGGFAALSPHLQVHFVSQRGGFTDTTDVQTSLNRGNLFGGATARFLGRLSLSAQVFSVPADLTTLRVAAAYDLR